MVLLTLSYGLFGFGYVHYRHVPRRHRPRERVRADRRVPLLVHRPGLMATVALFIWKPFVRLLGLGGVYVAALIIEAIGVLATVELPHSVAPLISGALFGATFLAITAYGLQIGRRLSPGKPAPHPGADDGGFRCRPDYRPSRCWVDRRGNRKFRAADHYCCHRAGFLRTTRHACDEENPLSGYKCVTMG